MVLEAGQSKVKVPENLSLIDSCFLAVSSHGKQDKQALSAEPIYEAPDAITWGAGFQQRNLKGHRHSTHNKNLSASSGSR